MIASWYGAHVLLISLLFSTAIGAMSYQLALRSGLFAFVSAGFWAVGAYAAGDIAVHTSLPWPVGLLLGMVMAAVGGYLLSLLFFRLNGLYLGMATFAFCLIVGILLPHMGSVTGNAGILAPVPNQVSIPMMLLVLVLVCLFMSRLEVGRLGRSQLLVHYDADLALSLGVNVTAWRHAVFIISGMIGALAGGLYALTFYEVDPSQIGFSAIVTGLATVVIGGRTSWRGCILGALVVVGFPGLDANLQQWEPVIYGAVLVMAAVFVPGGIFGLWQNMWQRRQLLQAGGPASAVDQFGDGKSAVEADPPVADVGRA